MAAAAPTGPIRTLVTEEATCGHCGGGIVRTSQVTPWWHEDNLSVTCPQK